MNPNTNKPISTTINPTNKNQFFVSDTEHHVDPTETQPPLKKQKRIEMDAMIQSSQEIREITRSTAASTGDMVEKIFHVFQKSAQGNSKNVEIEARLGYFYDSNFHSSVMEDDFETIQKYLEDKKFSVQAIEETDYFYENKQRISFDEKRKKILNAIVKEK